MSDELMQNVEVFYPYIEAYLKYDSLSLKENHKLLNVIDDLYDMLCTSEDLNGYLLRHANLPKKSIYRRYYTQEWWDSHKPDIEIITAHTGHSIKYEIGLTKALLPSVTYVTEDGLKILIPRWLLAVIVSAYLLKYGLNCAHDFVEFYNDILLGRKTTLEVKGFHGETEEIIEEAFDEKHRCACEDMLSVINNPESNIHHEIFLLLSQLREYELQVNLKFIPNSYVEGESNVKMSKEQPPPDDD